MSFDAMRWAMEQPIKPALTKFCLVTMAECVNAESAEMVCWPSYAFLAARTGMNTKTVESSVYDLKTQGYIVDTGRRAGDTGKVVVYRLNTTVNGGITQSATTPNANGTRPQNTTGNGAIQIPPNTAGNPPNSGDQSPQKTLERTPKTGVGIRNGSSNGTKKESGLDAACAALPEVPSEVLAAWLPIRRDKRAGPVTDLVAKALRREAERAGLTPEAAVTYCCEVGWQNFNAGFYAKREGITPTRVAAPVRESRFAAAGRTLFGSTPNDSEVIDVEAR